MLNAGDTAWVLASAALVMLMTPGLAFFYGGMVRSKSVLNMLMMMERDDGIEVGQVAGLHTSDARSLNLKLHFHPTTRGMAICGRYCTARSRCKYTETHRDVGSSPISPR